LNGKPELTGSYNIASHLPLSWRKAQEAFMSCVICRNLEQAYLAELSEYIKARSSICYQVSTMLVAQKNVDMERARYELEEHRKVCIVAAAASAPRLLPERARPERGRPEPVRQRAA
jgi:hypothetical protein